MMYLEAAFGYWLARLTTLFACAHGIHSNHVKEMAPWQRGITPWQHGTLSPRAVGAPAGVDMAHTSGVQLRILALDLHTQIQII